MSRDARVPGPCDPPATSFLRNCAAKRTGWPSSTRSVRPDAPYDRRSLDSDVNYLRRGALVVGAVVLGGYLADYAFNLALTRFLAPHAYGDFRVAYSFAYFFGFARPPGRRTGRRRRCSPRASRARRRSQVGEYLRFYLGAGDLGDDPGGRRGPRPPLRHGRRRRRHRRHPRRRGGGPRPGAAEEGAALTRRLNPQCNSPGGQTLAKLARRVSSISLWSPFSPARFRSSSTRSESRSIPTKDFPSGTGLPPTRRTAPRRSCAVISGRSERSTSSSRMERRRSQSVCEPLEVDLLFIACRLPQAL